MGDCLRDDVEVLAIDVGADVHGLHYQGTYADSFFEVREDPSLPTYAGLFEQQLAPGVDVGEQAPTEVHALKYLAFHADDVARAGIDPDPPPQAGQRLGGGVWRSPLRVGCVVHDDSRET